MRNSQSQLPVTKISFKSEKNGKSVSFSNVLIVKELWLICYKCRGDLADGEKSSYINAVLCLAKAPSKLDASKYPGAKTRYDDFVAVHLNQTLSIHGTVFSLLQSPIRFTR